MPYISDEDMDRIIEELEMRKRFSLSDKMRERVDDLLRRLPRRHQGGWIMPTPPNEMMG